MLRIIPKDFIASLFFLGAGGIFALQAFLIEDPESSLFVFMCLTLYFAMATIIMIKSIVDKSQEKYSPIYSFKTISIFLCLFAFRFLISLTGFYISAALFIFIVNLICLQGVDKKRIVSTGVFTAILVLVLYFICNFALNIVF